MTKIFVGAYAASPCHSQWDPVAEARYLDGLAQMSEIRGLEIPFFGGDVHRHDPAWFLEHLNPSWDYVLTAIPGTMETLAASPHFGLASRTEAGRQAALDFAEKSLLAIRKINERLGRSAVRAVEIHSAPQLGKDGAASSVDVFAESLSELASWDWQGARLLVEHCDRYRTGTPPAKGFLSIEDEIAALKQARPGKTATGILINWGRSAIETRNPSTPLQHIEAANAANCLGGLIFSGATQEDALYGHWADSHAPFAGPDCPSSLLTAERVRECLKAADHSTLPICGFKMQALPKNLDVPARLKLVESWAKFLVANT